MENKNRRNQMGNVSGNVRRETYSPAMQRVANNYARRSTQDPRLISRGSFMRGAGAIVGGAIGAGLFGSGIARAQEAGGGEKIVYPEDSLETIQAAINNHAVVKFSHLTRAGVEQIYYLSGTMIPALLKITTPTKLMPLDPNQKPTIDFDNGQPSALGQGIDINIQNGEVSLEGLIIVNHGALLSSAVQVARGNSGNVMIKDCIISSEQPDSSAIMVYGSGKVTIMGNQMTGIPPLSIGSGYGGDLGRFNGNAVVINNDLYSIGYGHTNIACTGIDIFNTSPTSSVFIHNNQIHLQPSSAPTTNWDYGFFPIPQALFGIFIGNFVWGTGAYNIDINRITIDSTYPINIPILLALSKNCSVQNVTSPPGSGWYSGVVYEAPWSPFGYWGDGIAFLTFLVQEVANRYYTTPGTPGYYDPDTGLPTTAGGYQLCWQDFNLVGQLPPTDVAFIVRSTGNTLIDNIKPYCNIFDSTDPNNYDEIYQGDNILLGRIKKVKNIVPPPQNVQIPDLTPEQIEGLKRKLMHR